LVSLIVFIFQQKREKYPLLDLKIFKIRHFTSGIVALLLNAIVWSAVLLLLSLEFQLARNSTPLQAGIEIIPFELAFLAVGPLSGRLSDKYGHLLFTVSGLLLSGLGLFLFNLTPSTAPYSVFAFHMILLGVGTGLFLAPIMRTIMDSAPINRRGISSATMLLFFNIGLTLSLNVALLVMSLTAPYSLISKILTSVNPGTIPASEIALFSASLKNTYLWLAVIDLLALVPLLMGGRRKRSGSPRDVSKEVIG